MSWTEQRFKQAVERGELRFFPRCARSYLYFKAKRGYNGNIDNRNDNRHDGGVYHHLPTYILLCKKRLNK